FNKIQKARISQVFYFHSPIVSVKLETNVNYLIHNCEQKSYYFSSHTYRKGFSREKTDSQCQHANHRKLHSCTSLPHRARGRAADRSRQEQSPRPSRCHHDPGRLSSWLTGFGGLRPRMASGRA